MPFNYTRSASWVDKEVLKFPTGLEAIKSVVVDATNVVVTDTGVRTVMPAGTILKFSSTNTKQYVEYNGSGTIRGILRRPVDIVARVTEGDTPAAMYFFGCVFATSAIVGFTLYASALVADLGNYNKFE
jgi:hypothetical protein